MTCITGELVERYVMLAPEAHQIPDAAADAIPTHAAQIEYPSMIISQIGNLRPGRTL